LLVVLTALSAACRLSVPETSEDGARLGITLEFPASAPVKAVVPASDLENTLHDLQIWVFRTDTKELVSHLSLDSSNPADDFPQVGGGVKHYSMRVDWDFALTRPPVDVFVLANAASIARKGENGGVSLSDKSEYDDVNDAVFGGDFFSPGSKITTVPTIIKEDNQEEEEVLGLPMAGAAKNLQIKGEAPSLSVADITLERMVSKVRFLFSQMLTETDNLAEKEVLSIEEIVLDGEVIPTQEYLFGPVHTPRWVNTYVESSVTYPGVNSVCSSPTPELYKYAGQTGEAYEAIIQSAKLQNRLTECGTYYLRESGKILSGEVHYKVVKGADTSSEKTTTGTAKFALSSEGDFSRNHTWTVYGYYVSDRTLQLSVNVLPWEKTDYTINYSESSLMVTWKLSVMDGTYARKEDVYKEDGKVDYTNIYLRGNQSCSAYLYVASPEGGQLEVNPVGDEDAFVVSFTSDAQEDYRFIDINPTRNNGRINIAIDRKSGVSITEPKKITLTFMAYTADRESKIDGESECIDQVYYFILQPGSNN